MRREVDPDVYCPQAALVDEETSRRTERRLARYRERVAAAKERRREELEMLASQRRQRQLWAAAALAAAAGWIWYKRRARRGTGGERGRRRGGGEEALRDLFLEEEDGGFDGTEEELRLVFDEAAKVARNFPDGMLDQRDQLMLYGLYKQATEGDQKGDAPSKMNVVAYAKYDAWGKFCGLPEQFAMKKYCEVVYHFVNGGESSFGKGDDNADVVYDEDKPADLDEDGCPITKEEAEGMPMGMGLKPSTLLGHADGGSRKETGSTPEARLRDAAISNDAPALREALEAVSDVDNTDEAGQTALHFAADRGSVECLRLLIEAGADPNATDCDGIGVLQTALSAGLDIDAVRLLLRAGADPDACDSDGDSPRSWVSEEGDARIVELFEAYPVR